MSIKILTAGSGPSYSKWPYWHTWTKLLPLYINSEHRDVSAPAAGNKFIARAIITAFDSFDPDIVLVQWNFEKFDCYLENQEVINEIISSDSIRNFLVDIHTSATTSGSGYWCSSVDDTVPWKKFYNRYIKSKTGMLIDDLEEMVLIQNLCQIKNIKYFFTTHLDVDHDFLKSNSDIRPFYNQINWNLMIHQESLTKLYKNSSFYSQDRDANLIRHAVPGPRFQHHYLYNIILPFLAAEGIHPREHSKKIKLSIDTHVNKQYQ